MTTLRDRILKVIQSKGLRDGAYSFDAPLVEYENKLADAITEVVEGASHIKESYDPLSNYRKEHQ